MANAITRSRTRKTPVTNLRTKPTRPSIWLDYLIKERRLQRVFETMLNKQFHDKSPSFSGNLNFLIEFLHIFVIVDGSPKLKMLLSKERLRVEDLAYLGRVLVRAVYDNEPSIQICLSMMEMTDSKVKTLLSFLKIVITDWIQCRRSDDVISVLIDDRIRRK